MSRDVSNLPYLQMRGRGGGTALMHLDYFVDHPELAPDIDLCSQHPGGIV